MEAGSAYSANSSNLWLQGEKGGTHSLFSHGLVSKMTALAPAKMRNRKKSVSGIPFPP